jgi:hypothetical protein
MKKNAFVNVKKQVGKCMKNRGAGWFLNSILLHFFVTKYAP